MLNIQPLLPKFPKSLLLFVGGLMAAQLLSGASAQAATCQDLFRSASKAELRQQAARQAMVSEVLAGLRERDATVTAMIDQIKRDLLSSIHARELSRQQVPRPRVMTGDERRMALETGTYNHVDMPTPLLRPMTEFEGILHDMQQARLVSLERTLAEGSRKIPESSLRWAAENPELLAVAYGQITGLVFRLGPDGQMLSGMINGNRLPKTKEISDLVDIVAALRASNTTPEATARMDQLMAEVLRSEIELTRSGERR